MEYSEEDWAWEIYTNGMKAKWVRGRVKDRKDFKGCDEYDEYMKMGKSIIESKKRKNGK